MAVQFLLGRSGTGKTYQCLSAIRSELQQKDSAPLIYLVPEQATFQAERAILASDGMEGYSRLSILSFDRLHYQLLGRNTARTHLSTLGRQMVVQKILRDCVDDLKVYKASALCPGFARQLAALIEELHRFDHAPEDVEQFLNKTDEGALGRWKFADIKRVYEAYLAYIDGRFVDPTRQFNEARSVVAKSEFFRGAQVWVDGFAGFTTSELLMLQEILLEARDTVIALCLDAQDLSVDRSQAASDPLDLFAPTTATYFELQTLLELLKVPVTEPQLLSEVHRFRDCAPLVSVEAGLFQTVKQPVTSADRIHLVRAVDRRAECRYVARRVRQMVQEQGLRYRDVAVIASDLSQYEHYVQAYLRDYDIPFFIDKQRPLQQHPCVTLVTAALRMAVDTVTTSDILAYLRTGLVHIDPAAIDRLEDYCLAFGIGTRDWSATSPWSFDSPEHPQFDEVAVNKTRKTVYAPLRRLRKGLSEQATLSALMFTQRVFAFLEQVKLAPAIELAVARAQEAGDPERADQYRQFYEWTMGLFEELCDVFGETPYAPEFLSSMLLGAFSQITLAQIPPSLDQVLVGSIERSRHPELKVVFLLGTTQKQFPSLIKQGGLLTDQDRELAETHGLRLAAGPVATLSQRRYLAYIAFTRPSEHLFITYPAQDEKGNAIVRSPFVDDLEDLFCDIQESQTDGTPAVSEALQSPYELMERMCRCVAEGVPLPEQGGSTSESLNHAMTLVRKASLYDNRATLASEVVQDLFPGTLRSSATRIGVYAACPYQYFSRYVLGLKPRKEFKLEPLDLGNFYHRVLELFVQDMIDRQIDWATLTPEPMSEQLNQVIERVMQEDRFLANFMAHSKTNAFIIQSACEVLHEAVGDMVNTVMAGALRPEKTEVSFGKEDSELGSYALTLGQNRQLIMQGVIDRVDTWVHNEQDTAMIVDYKRRDKTVQWTHLFYGLDMQLGVYLNALQHALKKTSVMGAFFWPVDLPAISVRLNESGGTGSGQRKAKGIFSGELAPALDANAAKDSRYYNFYVKSDGEPYGHYHNRGALEPDDFHKVLAFVDTKIKELASRLVSGAIDIAPYRLNNQSPCGYCDYGGLCRFDWQINHYTYLTTHSKTEVLEAIGGEQNHD
jgi:ATP-dependent helicase/nuclease subunit B